MRQNTDKIMMIRPVRFTYNEQTAESNSFQSSSAKAHDTQEKALKEFDDFVEQLISEGVSVHVADDTEEPHTPDSIFPNNWISMHENGLVGIYPMQAENRRLERRADLAQWLSDHFVVTDMLDLSGAEKEEKFLEGTGSMVLDRENMICYACLSPRTDKALLQQFCEKTGFLPIDFIAKDAGGKLIYHTNVVMCVGEKFMVVCMECIPDEADRKKIRIAAEKTGKQIVEISLGQLNHFAGNMLEVINNKGEHLLVMSEQAYKSLAPDQVSVLEKYARIVHAPLYTIEANGGGSARCMMAEIFLEPKKDSGNS